MSRLKFFLLIILILPLISKAQDYCLFIQNIQNYQDSVKLKSVGERNIIDSSTFDIHKYLSFFDSVEVERGIRIGVYYFDNFLNGNPYLYAVKNKQSLNDSNLKALYKYINKPELRAKNHIIPKDSENGFLQYLFFSEMGEQFALKWHSYYNEKLIVCSQEKLLNVINELSKSDLFSADSIGLEKLKDVSPKITIERNEKDFIVTWLENRTHSGIYRCSYLIERKAPFSIVKINEERLLEIQMNFIY